MSQNPQPKFFWSTFDDSLQKAFGLSELLASRTGSREFLERLSDKLERGTGIFGERYAKMVQRWQNPTGRSGPRCLGRGGFSKENWLLKIKHKRSSGVDLKGEVDLEFKIAQALDPEAARKDAQARGLNPKAKPVIADRCGSAVAASSGLFESKAGFCQIDLVHLLPDGIAEVIEVKQVSPPRAGVEVIVSAAFQVAKYGLLLIFTHEKAKALGLADDARFFKGRPLLACGEVHVKTLVNRKCYDAMKREFPSAPALLHKLSLWLGAELNAVARNHPSDWQIWLTFQHSFHVYPDERAVTGSKLSLKEVASWLKERVDRP